MAKKSYISYFDKVYLKNKGGHFCETSLSAKHRQKVTIEPIDKLLKDLEIWKA